MNQNGGIHKGGFAVLCHRNGGSESPGILKDGKLIISLDTEREELIEAEKAFLEKETRKLHERFLKEKKELHAQFVAERQAECAKDRERGKAYV